MSVLSRQLQAGWAPGWQAEADCSPWFLSLAPAVLPGRLGGLVRILKPKTRPNRVPSCKVSVTFPKPSFGREGELEITNAGGFFSHIYNNSERQAELRCLEMLYTMPKSDSISNLFSSVLVKSKMPKENPDTGCVNELKAKGGDLLEFRSCTPAPWPGTPKVPVTPLRGTYG